WLADFVDGFYKQENDEGNDQEVDDGHDEIAISKDHRASFLRGSQSGAGRNCYSRFVELDEEVSKTDIPQKDADDGHDQIFNQRFDDGTKSTADDNANSQIERVAFC